MARESKVAPKLAAVLEQYREQIFASRAKDPRAGRFLLLRAAWTQLHTSTAGGFGATAEALTTASHTVPQTHLADVSLARLRTGFKSSAVTEALLRCKGLALPAIQRDHPLISTATWVSISQAEGYPGWLVRGFSVLHAAETDRILEKQQRRDAIHPASGSRVMKVRPRV
jgi:hypothetical protein